VRPSRAHLEHDIRRAPPPGFTASNAPRRRVGHQSRHRGEHLFRYADADHAAFGRFREHLPLPFRTRCRRAASSGERTHARSRTSVNISAVACRELPFRARAFVLRRLRLSLTPFLPLPRCAFLTFARRISLFAFITAELAVRTWALRVTGDLLCTHTERITATIIRTFVWCVRLRTANAFVPLTGIYLPRCFSRGFRNTPFRPRTREHAFTRASRASSLPTLPATRTCLCGANAGPQIAYATRASTRFTSFHTDSPWVRVRSTPRQTHCRADVCAGTARRRQVRRRQRLVCYRARLRFPRQHALRGRCVLRASA